MVECDYFGTLTLLTVFQNIHGGLFRLYHISHSYQTCHSGQMMDLSASVSITDLTPYCWWHVYLPGFIPQSNFPQNIHVILWLAWRENSLLNADIIWQATSVEYLEWYSNRVAERERESVYRCLWSVEQGINSSLMQCAVIAGLVDTHFRWWCVYSWRERERERLKDGKKIH